MFLVKKILLSILCNGFLFGVVGFGSVSEASELEKNAEIPVNVVSEEDEFYYVVDDNDAIQSRTWSKTQSYKIKKGARTYLGTYTTNRKTTLQIKFMVGPAEVKLGGSYSESGKFKKYKQNVTVTVTYKRYRKIDNKYVDTKTVTSNTSYTDYVAI